MTNRILASNHNRLKSDDHYRGASLDRPDWLRDGARWTRRMPDGNALTVRVVSQADRATLRRFFDGLSSEVVEKRFNQCVVSAANLERLVMNRRGVTLTAARESRVVALAELYDTTPSHGVPRTCELAVLVHQEHQRRGIGETLVHELMRIAKTCGYQKIEWLALRNNHAILALTGKTGAALCTFPEDRAYVRAVAPVWFSGLGRSVQRRIMSLLPPESRSALAEADPCMRGVADDAPLTQGPTGSSKL